MFSSLPLQAQTFTRAQVQNDIDFTVKTLKSVHPNLYAHQKPKEFAALFKGLRESVGDNMSNIAAMAVIQKVLASVCDEHTSVKLTEVNQIFDLKILEDALKPRYFGDQLAATKDNVFMDNPALAFNPHTVQSVNDRSPEEIRKLLTEIVNADGCTDDGILFTRFLGLRDRLILSNFLNIDKKYTMNVRSRDEDTTRSFAQISRNIRELISEIQDQSAHEASSKLLKKNGIPFIEQNFNNPHDSDNLGIVVNSNADNSIYYIYSYGFMGGKKQMDKTNKLLRKMIKNKPKHVILDLTDNPGGRLRTASHLLSYFLNKSHLIANQIRSNSARIKKPLDFEFLSKERGKSYRKSARKFRSARRKNGQHILRIRKTAFGNPDYEGKLSVLVSPRTRSAGTVVASVLKRMRDAKLIGYLNAGSTKTSCFAADGYYILPETKVAIVVPNTCYDRPLNAKQNGSKPVLDIAIDPLAGSTNKMNTRILKAALDDIANLDQ